MIKVVTTIEKYASGEQGYRKKKTAIYLLFIPIYSSTVLFT